MTKFEDLFEDLDTHTQVMDSSMSAAMTLSTPQDQVEGLMKQVSMNQLRNTTPTQFFCIIFISLLVAFSNRKLLYTGMYITMHLLA